MALERDGAKMGNVIDLDRARALRRRRVSQLEINWFAVMVCTSIAAWVAMFEAADRVWNHG